MHARKAYSYAVFRVVPRIEREEFLNVGTIVFCPELRFLEAQVHLDELGLATLWPAFDLSNLRRHVEANPRICAGLAEGGAIARLAPKERFHWLTAPRSTGLQCSAVRSGLTEDPAATLAHLLAVYVTAKR